MAGDITQDIEKFHRWSRTYERSIGQFFLFGPVHRAVLRLVGRELGRAPETVLDIGCGTGRLLRRAAQRWPASRLTGVDPAEGMIGAARHLSRGITLKVGKGEAIPLPHSSIDVAFSTVSFHHWEDQVKGVRDVARVLRPKGLFCLADGFVPGLFGSIVPHTRMHTALEFREIFQAAGLVVRKQRHLVYGAVLATVGEKR